MRKNDFMKEETEKMDRCPGCSGDTEYYDNGLRRCTACGGISGYATMERALRHVAINEPMQRDCANPRYFDIQFNHTRRAHGWYDPETKRVVQYG